MSERSLFELCPRWVIAKAPEDLIVTLFHSPGP